MANIMKRNSGTTPAISGVIDNVFRNGLSRFFDDDFWGFNGMLNGAQVPVNIRETEKTYEMEVVAPGLRKEDFNVNLNKNMLTLSFEKDENKTEGKEEEGWMRREHTIQSFSRSFSLDETVDPEKITAEYHDGILHLSLPKREGAQNISKNIEIK
jgi:HSP20 family protein